MSDTLNVRRQPGDLSDRTGRAFNIIGQLEKLLRDIADAPTASQAQVWAQQGLDLISTLDRLNAADPQLPKPREVDHAFELDYELLRAEAGAPWNGGL